MATTLAELKQIGIVNALRRSQLFAGVSAPELNAIADFTVIKSVAKGVLAAELGTVSESFSRTLAKFREQGLIEVKGQTVIALCPAKLTSLLPKNLSA